MLVDFVNLQREHTASPSLGYKMSSTGPVEFSFHQDVQGKKDFNYAPDSEWQDRQDAPCSCVSDDGHD